MSKHLEATFIPLADIDAWEAFYDANQDEIEALGGFDICFELARNQRLMIGGGSSPLFRVGFVDNE